MELNSIILLGGHYIHVNRKVQKDSLDHTTPNLLLNVIAIKTLYTVHAAEMKVVIHVD